MQEVMVHIQVFTQEKTHHVWIRDTYIIRDFLQDIQDSWILENTSFEHFFYHVESNCVLDSTLSFRQNQVVSGDHCILF